MKNKETNKDYIMIKKETVSNFFFGGILICALLFLIWIIVLNVLNINNKVENDGTLNTDLIAYNEDTNLHILYPYPGGNWVEAELDTSGIESVVEESSGEDNIFELTTDTLTEEVLSALCYNDEGLEGYRQFMSFTFRPSQEFKNDEDFINYCKESFKRDIENSGDFISIEITSAVQDENDGVLMKLKLVVSTESDEDTSESSATETLYYTQYIKRIGVNMGIVTFGSIAEDNTVDIYLQYFLNNIKSTNLLNS